MPRTYAPLLTSIWGDEDFTGWPSSAQRTFMMMMSQPNATYAGVLAYTPKRWARMAPDTTVQDIEADVEWLHNHGKVILDETTEEVWLRSFIRANKVIEQRQLHASLRKDYAGIVSKTITRAIVCTLDPAGRSVLGVSPTTETHNGRSEDSPPATPAPSPEGSAAPLPAPTRRGPGQRPEPEPLPEPEPSSSSESDSRPANPTADDDEQLARSAIRLLAQRDLARRENDKGPVADYEAWLAKATTRRHDQHHAQALELARAEPGLSARQLADRLAPPTPGPQQPPDPTSTTIAANRTLAERNRRRANGQACTTCNDDAIVLDDHNTARPCPTCNPLA